MGARSQAQEQFATTDLAMTMTGGLEHHTDLQSAVAPWERSLSGPHGHEHKYNLTGARHWQWAGIHAQALRSSSRNKRGDLKPTVATQSLILPTTTRPRTSAVLAPTSAVQNTDRQAASRS